MAVVKCNYVKQGTNEKARAKASIRYIQHRRGKDNAKLSRILFNSDGAMKRSDAYRLIDEAEKGSVFFRFVISPDPKTEDTRRDLSLRDITEQTMLSFQEQSQKSVSWVAAIHDDHTDIRHVHIVAVVAGRIARQDFQALPKLLRDASSQACLAQRQERDLTQAQQEREREEAAWERSY